MRRAARLMAALACAAAAGCTAARPASPVRPDPAAAIAAAPEPHLLPAFDGKTGRPWEWDALIARIGASDAVFIGELHDDAAAHRLQAAVMEAMCVARPGAALSMEMLERDDQPVTDAYLEGSMSRDDFIDGTGVRDWAGKGTWLPWYQPMIEVARSHGSPVIAANAPRRFVARARTEGYGPLEALPPEERALFALPPGLPRDAYRQRLADLMRDARKGSGEPAPADEEVDALQRAQLVWDATMGESAAKALDRAPAVVHMAGAFHVSREGATVTEFRRHRPSARVLTIVCVREPAERLRDEDRGLADVVVYTPAAGTASPGGS